MTYAAIGSTRASVDSRAIIYLSLLSIAAAYFLAWPVWRAGFLVEIWPTESWNAYLQDAAAAGAPLYPSPDSLVGNNYPPLSFYAVALLGKLSGLDNLFAGRALSLVALATITLEVFAAARLLTGGSLGAAVGALWYLAIMARNSTVYIGTNDPQLAGLAIMGAALVWFLRLHERKQSPTPALLLMVVAGFWKHNNIAIPLVAISWLFFQRDRYAYRATLVSGAAMLAGLAACVAIFGSDFIPNLLANRNYAWSNVLGNIGHLQWCALALLIWVLWSLCDWQSKSAQFTALHIGLGLFACILQWFGHGVSGNAEFDLILALGIGTGAAFTRIEASWLAKRVGADRCRDLMIAALLLRLIASDRQETALLLFSKEFRSSFYASQSNAFREAERVATISGDVACATKLVCRLAGKRFAVDEFKTEELVATGKATQAEITAMLESHRIRWFPNSAATGAEPNTSFFRVVEKARLAPFPSVLDDPDDVVADDGGLNQRLSAFSDEVESAWFGRKKRPLP